MSLKVTLDTNVLIDSKKADFLARIKQLADKGAIEIAVNTLRVQPTRVRT